MVALAVARLMTSAMTVADNLLRSITSLVAVLANNQSPPEIEATDEMTHSGWATWTYFESQHSQLHSNWSTFEAAMHF